MVFPSQQQSHSFPRQRGVTLVELLLYVSITAVMLILITVLVTTLLQSRVKNQTIAEVEQQGVQVMQQLTQTIRNAEGINSPAAGASASSLSLDVPDTAEDPTVFDASGGALRVSRGGGGATALTNSRVGASAVSFDNRSPVDTPGTIRIQFTLTHNNPENRHEYEYEQTFFGSASLRQ